MKKLGLRGRFAGFTGIVIMVFVSAAAVQTLLLQGQRDDWHNLKDQALARDHLLTEIRSQLGYGSLIHNFKNYVLRGQAGYYRQLTENHAALSSGIKRYRQLDGLTMSEGNALDNIQRVADQYLASATAVRNLLARGADSGSIDKSVKISDEPAIQGLSDLQARYAELLAKYVRKIESRADPASGTAFVLMAASLAVILLVALLFYRYLSAQQRAVRTVPGSQPHGVAGEISNEDGSIANSGAQHVSRIFLLSEETAAAVERNKAVIAELDHKAQQ
ncbi:hypothetical protein [Aliamphritea hakodatensis]|uniref:hypothetical protein n=1 Tax=Aliamphritea hakodatensis TaxID=2895352 RepID=UPI0022FD96E4|nr:hypothetical protein [Aliamphritea hakodatensis]